LKSWRNFCNTTTVTRESKYHFAYYNLDRYHAIAFISYKDDDTSYLISADWKLKRTKMEILSKSVQNTFKQLCIVLSSIYLRRSNGEQAFRTFIERNSSQFLIVHALVWKIRYDPKDFAIFKNLNYLDYSFIAPNKTSDILYLSEIKMIHLGDDREINWNFLTFRHLQAVKLSCSKHSNVSFC
jgi:hypothetical protein